MKEEKEKLVKSKAEEYGKKCAPYIIFLMVIWGAPFVTKFIWIGSTYWNAFRLHLVFYWIVFAAAILWASISSTLVKKDATKENIRIFKEGE